MTVQPTTLNRSGVLPAVAKEWGMARAPQAAAAPTQREASDQAVVSDQARQLSAAVVAPRELPKLHLSPPELRELVSPPESR